MWSANYIITLQYTFISDKSRYNCSNTTRWWLLVVGEVCTGFTDTIHIEKNMKRNTGTNDLPL